MERKFWAPSVTGQFIDCPIPYHLDTYKGCVYGCVYCFARNPVEFSRRNSSHKTFAHIVGNEPKKIEEWIERTLKKEYDFTHGEEVAFKDRIPLKIGANADPFPPIERSAKITYETLKVFEKYDYPLEIQTKNPAILAEYACDFQNPNWVIAVTVISSDEEFIRIVEPHTPSIKERFDAIESLTKGGKNVMVKCQPAIYPKVISDLPEIVRKTASSGCFAINMEGLKITSFLTQRERDLYSKMSSALGYDVIDFYKQNGQRRNPAEWTIGNNETMEYLALGEELAHSYGIKFFCADDNVGKIGDSDECCGTEVLRNYTKWCGNRRTLSFGANCEKCSENIGLCVVKSSRTNNRTGKTLNEIVGSVMQNGSSSQEELF